MNRARADPIRGPGRRQEQSIASGTGLEGIGGGGMDARRGPKLPPCRFPRQVERSARASLNNCCRALYGSSIVLIHHAHRHPPTKHRQQDARGKQRAAEQASSSTGKGRRRIEGFDPTHAPPAAVLVSLAPPTLRSSNDDDVGTRSSRRRPTPLVSALLARVHRRRAPASGETAAPAPAGTAAAVVVRAVVRAEPEGNHSGLRSRGAGPGGDRPFARCVDADYGWRGGASCFKRWDL